MELVLPKPLPSWEDFSSVALRPLRVQMMGSVVVSIHIFRVVQLNEIMVNVVFQLAACVYLMLYRLVNWLLMKDGPSTLGEGLVITLLTLEEDWLCTMMCLCVWL